MTILELFASLRSIKPRSDYQVVSRRAILAEEPRPARQTFSFFHIIRSGSSVALVGVLLLVFASVLSFVKSFTPLGVSSLDPVGLTAEATAIDIQIKLTDVSYRETAGIPVAIRPDVARSASAHSVVSSLAAVTSTSSMNDVSSPTIEDVLNLLAN